MRQAKRSLPDKLVAKITAECDKWFEETANGMFKDRPDYSLLRTVYHNGALEMYCKILDVHDITVLMLSEENNIGKQHRKTKTMPRTRGRVGKSIKSRVI